MSGLLVPGLVAALLVVLDLMAISFGVDSRDGFVEDSLRPVLR